MSNKKTLLSLAVASALGVASMQASAAPTVYGDLSFVLLYTGAYSDTAGADGSETSYSLSDNVSLLGVKGEAAKIGSTSYYYDFNFILDGGSPTTHLAVVGMKGGLGDLSVGTRVNGLFGEMVDGSTYVTNWFYTPGMSALQVSNGVTYMGSAGSVSYGVQAFDIAKGSDTKSSSTNFTAAGSYAAGDLTIGLGFTNYTETNPSSDTNQFGDAQNVYSGVTIKNVAGISVGYSAGKFGVVAAYDARKPVDTSSNTSAINTAMLTGTFAVSDKTSLAANFSNTSQSGGVKGTIITAMVSYAPTDALLYTFEVQNSNSDANTYSLTGSTGAGGTKSNTGFAAGVIYNF